MIVAPVRCRINGILGCALSCLDQEQVALYWRRNQVAMRKEGKAALQRLARVDGSREAFTVVELLVVIAIEGALISTRLQPGGECVGAGKRF